MTYMVKIVDTLGIFTKRGYQAFQEAENACRLYGLDAEGKQEPKLLYARVIDSNGRIRYDFSTDMYDWEDSSLNERVTA